MTPANTLPIIDLHCDLLSYLSNSDETRATDRATRCSFPQLHEGNVAIQTLAMFTMTEPRAPELGLKQARIFQELDRTYAKECYRIDRRTNITDIVNNRSNQCVGIVAAIENASSLCADDEPFAETMKRLREFQRLAGPLLYVSLTWHNENRFGGGNKTTVGLKNDGKELLHMLRDEGIAVDISHTSYRLADDILEYDSANNLQLKLLASHTDFRSVCKDDRNITDEAAQEIAQRGGIIGLNFMAPFVGKEDSKNLARQAERALQLDLASHLAFGADFFCIDHLPQQSLRSGPNAYFFKEYDSSSCYAAVVDLFRTELGLNQEQRGAIAHGNAARFITEILQQ